MYIIQPEDLHVNVIQLLRDVNAIRP